MSLNTIWLCLFLLPSRCSELSVAVFNPFLKTSGLLREKLPHLMIKCLRAVEGAGLSFLHFFNKKIMSNPIMLHVAFDTLALLRM